MARTSNTAHRRLRIRWTIRRDLENVLAVEAGLPDAWAKDDYLTALRERQVISMVAEDYRTEAILGVMVYRLHETHLKLLRLAVRPDVQRTGVGLELMEKLIYKVCSHHREAVYCRVPDGNLPFHLFLRSCGFAAVATVRGDYLFELRIGDTIREQLGFRPLTDRIETCEET